MQGCCGFKITIYCGSDLQRAQAPRPSLPTTLSMSTLRICPELQLGLRYRCFVFCDPILIMFPLWYALALALPVIMTFSHMPWPREQAQRPCSTVAMQVEADQCTEGVRFVFLFCASFSSQEWCSELQAPVHVRRSMGLQSAAQRPHILCMCGYLDPSAAVAGTGTNRRHWSSQRSGVSWRAAGRRGGCPRVWQS
jgi:hypothetical protein